MEPLNQFQYGKTSELLEKESHLTDWLKQINSFHEENLEGE